MPRPYVLRVAPEAPLTYAPGQTFEFTLVIFGAAAAVFPYVLLGLQEVGERGLGAGRAGRFRLTEVWAEHPLAGRQERLYRAADGALATPGLPVDAAAVAAEAAALSGRVSAITRQLSAFSAEPSHVSREQLAPPLDLAGDHASGAQHAAPPQESPASTTPREHRAQSTPHSALRLSFRTPTRLIEGGRLVKPDTFELRPVLARLLERLDALGTRYGTGPTGMEQGALLEAAEGVRIVERRLAWRDLFRGSGRHGRQLPMGGLVGDVALDGELAPLLPWLLWGSLVHVGKDAAMGNGLLAVAVV